MAEENRIPRLSVIQDFNSKKAVAHASFLVASIFGLFSILSLMKSFVQMPFHLLVSWNSVQLVLLSLTYWLVWLFGFYSMHNFFLYTTIAQHAEHEIGGILESDIMREAEEGWIGFTKTFANFKIPSPRQGRIRKHLESIFRISYLIIGLFPFLAFLLYILT